MSRTYKATGINLKSMPLGESDRLLTILTREYGLIRAIAPGSRKHNSRLGGRSELFVVNELLIARGRSLDKVTQAETLESYPGLAQDLKKLITSQYLAELCLCQALSDQPQEELFCLLNEHLERLERSSSAAVLAHLSHAMFQLLILAGVAPQVHSCCITRQPLTPTFTDPGWRVGFSIPAGGTVSLAALETLLARPTPNLQPRLEPSAAAPKSAPLRTKNRAAEAETQYDRQPLRTPAHLNKKLSAIELELLQQLAQVELPQVQSEDLPDAEEIWQAIERNLRHYAQYHFDRPIRSAALIDACFTTAHPALTP